MHACMYVAMVTDKIFVYGASLSEPHINGMLSAIYRISMVYVTLILSIMVYANMCMLLNGLRAYHKMYVVTLVRHRHMVCFDRYS